jgi:hypothetical protein
MSVEGISIAAGWVWAIKAEYFNQIYAASPLNSLLLPELITYPMPLEHKFEYSSYMQSTWQNIIITLI